MKLWYITIIAGKKLIEMEIEAKITGNFYELPVFTGEHIGRLNYLPVGFENHLAFKDYAYTTNQNNVKALKINLIRSRRNDAQGESHHHSEELKKSHELEASLNKLLTEVNNVQNPQ